MRDFLWYKLVDRKPVGTNDVTEIKLDDPDRRVGLTQVGKYRISTVFLNLDHGFGGQPKWFETCIFGPNDSDVVERYETWEEAEVGHAKYVERLEKAK